MHLITQSMKSAVLEHKSPCSLNNGKKNLSKYFKVYVDLNKIIYVM